MFPFQSYQHSNTDHHISSSNFHNCTELFRGQLFVKAISQGYLTVAVLLHRELSLLRVCNVWKQFFHNSELHQLCYAYFEDNSGKKMAGYLFLPRYGGVRTARRFIPFSAFPRASGFLRDFLSCSSASG